MCLIGMTRPDPTNAARAVARNLRNACERHWVAVEQTVAYLNATRDLGIMYERGNRLSLDHFADADYTSKAAERRAISVIAGM